MRMEKLFTYGTLQDPDTQKQVLGRTLGGGVPDTLLGYRLARLNGIHFVYSILQPHSGSRVEGLLVEVSGEELEKLDAYEGEAYVRVSARLVSKTRAWVYIENPKSEFRSHIEVIDS